MRVLLRETFVEQGWARTSLTYVSVHRYRSIKAEIAWIGRYEGRIVADARETVYYDNEPIYVISIDY